MSEEKAYALIEYLVGSCKALYEAEEYLEIEVTQNICEIIDQHIFECTCCGWWQEMSEMNEEQDWICNECAE